MTLLTSWANSTHHVYSMYVPPHTHTPVPDIDHTYTTGHWYKHNTSKYWSL